MALSDKSSGKKISNQPSHMIIRHFWTLVCTLSFAAGPHVCKFEPFSVWRRRAHLSYENESPSTI